MSGVFFGGKLLQSPVSASVVNDDAMRNSNLTVGNVVAIVGYSSGGQPLTALRFGTPAEAVAALVSGELLDGVLAAFDPSSDTNAPSQVIAVRVNPAVQATSRLLDAGATPVISLTSVGYGIAQNQVKVKVEAGSISGRRLTTQLGTSYYTKDNVGRQAMSILYTGAAASATLTITGSALTLEAPTGTQVALLDLTHLTTVQQVSDSIALVAGFTSSVLDSNYTAPALNGLDFVTAVDVKTAAYTVRADLQACVDWFNSVQQGFVTATRLTGAGTIPAVAPFAPLSGGSDGVTTNTQWASAFETLQTVDVQWLASMSGDPAIAAMTDAHALFMSTAGRRERRAIAGTAAGTSQLDAIAAAKALNSDRTSLVFQGHYDYDANGLLKLYPPYVSAARIAGAFAGVNPGTPLTNKNFKCRGLEFNLRNPVDTDVLLEAGLYCLMDSETGFKTVKSISTWLVNDNYNRVEQSCGSALDTVVRNVRDALSAVIGAKGNPLVLARAASIVKATLDEASRAEPQGPGLLAGDAANPPYRNITVSLEGDVLRAQFECSPVIPVNYALTTVFAVPYSGVSIAA